MSRYNCGAVCVLNNNIVIIILQSFCVSSGLLLILNIVS